MHANKHTNTPVRDYLVQTYWIPSKGLHTPVRDYLVQTSLTGSPVRDPVRDPVTRPLTN